MGRVFFLIGLGNGLTAKRPITIIGKKLPIIHSNTMAKMRRTGPTKKKMPLVDVSCGLVQKRISG